MSVKWHVKALTTRVMEWTNELKGWIMLAFIPLLAVMMWPLWAFPWMAYMTWFIWRQFFRVEYEDPMSKVVYVTGCDSGFGQAAAIDLDLRGCHVFAGCLQPRGEGAECLRAQCSDRLHILDLDLTNEEKVTKCAVEIEDFCSQNDIPGLWALYNNAGVAMAGEVEWVSMADYMKSADVNLWGTIRVTKSVLHLIRNARGRVVTVTSGISRAVSPGRSPYCITKSGLEAFTDCLRYEMRKFGVKVITLQPGNFTGVTNVFQMLSRQVDSMFTKIPPKIRNVYGETYLRAFKESVCGSYRQQGSSMAVDSVVDSIRDAVLSKRPRCRYTPMQLNWILWLFFHSFLPTDLVDVLVAYWQRKMPPPAMNPDAPKFTLWN